LATVQAYYNGIRDFNNVKNYRMAIETSLVNMWKETLFPNETNDSRFIYAPNENCFRKRMEQTQTNNLEFPFINYKLKAFQYDNSVNWRTYSTYQNGIYIDEIGQLVKLMPIVMEYEATFWCNRDDELRYASTVNSFIHGTVEQKVEFSLGINNQNLDFFARQQYTDSSIDAEFTERDWLEENKIHSLSLSSELRCFVFLTDLDISITEECILQFTSIHQLDEDYINSETFTINNPV